MEFVLATKNKGKLEEFRVMFGKLGHTILSEEEFNVGEIVEDGNSFEENSLIKAKTVSEISNMPAIADDSGLCIEDLDGGPGIYTARMFPECDNYADKCQKLVDLVNSKNGNRKAKFVCVITVYMPGGETHYFRGETEGEISDSLKGNLGHGYDPVFYSYDLGKNFGQASTEEKNTVSHRGRAFQKLKEYLSDK